MLKINDLTLEKDDFSLGPVTLSVAQVDYFTLLGPTGSGKTLLLESIAGFHDVAGKIIFDGIDITDMPPEKRCFGFVFSNYALFPHLNVERNIKYSAKFLKKSSQDERELTNIISFLNIEHLLKRTVQTLSSGEQQRVAIARALYSKPRLLLLDEPLNSLDPGTRERIISKLAELPGHFGVPVIHVTHSLKVVEKLAGITAIMINGNIRQVGATDKVLECPIDNDVADFLAGQPVFSSKGIT